MSQETFVMLKFLNDNNSSNNITDELKLPSAISWNKGDINPKTRMPYKENGWQITSDLDKGVDIFEKIKNLLEIVEPHQEKVKELAKEWDILLSCVIYYYDYQPALYFEDSIIKRISELGASLDIDLYDMRE